MTIVDSTETPVVYYSYDAWGYLINITGSQATILGTLNPIRYRGYYYDTETGYYYLQSRYYDPLWGRFINADGFVHTGATVLGGNMYAYCENNPANNYDADGHSKINWQATARVAGAALLIIGVAALSSVTGGAAGAALASIAWAGYTGFVFGYAVGSVIGYRLGGWAGATALGSQYCLSWTVTFMMQEFGRQLALSLLKKFTSNAIKSLDDLIAKTTLDPNTKSKNFTNRFRQGGYDQAVKDFNSLSGKKNVRVLNNSNYEGKICNVGCYEIHIRNGSSWASNKYPTMEIKYKKTIITKIRYK